MKSFMFTFFGALSIIVAITSLFWTVIRYRRVNRAKRVLSSIQLFTIGVFAAAALGFIPIYFMCFSFGDNHAFLRPFLLSLHNSLRLFILDGEFDIVVDALVDQQEIVRVIFSVHMAFLYVIAPVLTFGMVLSLFVNIKDEMRFRWHRFRDMYIMSELNEKSLVLAKSIYERAKEENKKVVIVFADALKDNKADDCDELNIDARNINAICLKKDVIHLNFMNKIGNVEIFLISENESENISKALEITDKLNERAKKINVKIFTFSRSSSSAYIVDSARYDNLLRDIVGDDNKKENAFKLRRINEIQQHVWKTVPQMGVFEIARRNNKKLSVLIVGLGEYGMEFFKMLTWFCQFEGYSLEINVIDKMESRKNGDNAVESRIRRQCPELLLKNRCGIDGESDYDIEIFSGVDITGNDFSDMINYNGDNPDRIRVAQRLRGTNLAIVALGDDVNIEVSVYLRTVFDRIKGVTAKKGISADDEPVEIYSIVYDDQKAGILHGSSKTDSGTEFLVNHKNIPYHIHFTGAMSTRFDYKYIYDENVEKMAFRQHESWIEIEQKIHDQLLERGEQLNKNDWYYEDAMKDDARIGSRKDFEKFEYFRMSSTAKELYRMQVANDAVLREETTCLYNGEQTCMCANCERRKKSEHMRWNAYTRVIGYSFSERRADRARLHNNLRPWDELHEYDKYKD